MARFRMQIIEPPPGDRRPRYRGTGFNLEPGGVTEISVPSGQTWGFDGGVLTARPGRWVTFLNAFRPDNHV